MFSRFTLYFDEVVRSGSIRRASERLNISPSAIDRHILLMEENLGVQLFERMPQGLRLTAAGEVLITHVRRWRRELRHARAQIDDLRGLRRGEVTIALVEGVAEFVAGPLVDFRAQYPGIDHSIQVAGAQGVVDLVLEGRAEIGLTFNPPNVPTVRLERTLVYQLGAVVPAGHPLAGCEEVGFAECADHGLVIPDETISLRAVLDTMWARTIGGRVRGATTASSIGLIKALVLRGAGVGMLTAIDVAGEIAAGTLLHIPLAEANVPLSVFSLITAGGRTLSVPASLLVQHIGEVMRGSDATGIG
ncbi:MAG TPA: LysR family transcriptional regulator [Sphingomonas sp.]